MFVLSRLVCGAQICGHFQADVSSYLQLLCLAENMRTDVRDVSSLLDWNRCDIRQSLLHLQFWACSGGGKQVQKPLLTSGKHFMHLENDWVLVYIVFNINVSFHPVDVGCNVKSDIHQSVKSEDLCGDGLPPCHSACTESMLGIRNLETGNVEELLLKVGVYKKHIQCSFL